MKSKQISRFVKVIIDDDEDVHIVDKFAGTITTSILPKEEAVLVAKYILEELDK